MSTGSRLWVGPAGASLFHEQIRERWRSHEHTDFLRKWFGLWRQQGMTGGRLEDQIGELWYGVSRAPLYALEEPAAALIEHSAPSFGRQALRETDLPSPHGFVISEYPFQDLLDLKQDSYQAVAFLWETINDAAGQRGVLVFTFDNLGGIEDRSRYSAEFADYLRGVLPPISLLHVGFLKFGMAPQELPVVSASAGDPLSTEAEASIRSFWQYVQSFWAFVQQRVVIPVPSEHPRPVRKRAAKAEQPLPALNVIRLRRADYGVKPSETPHHVDWRFRWCVSGHWRHLPEETKGWKAADLGARLR
jgi:hypothetical protein